MNRQDAKSAKKIMVEPPRRQDAKKTMFEPQRRKGAKKIFFMLPLFYLSFRRMPESSAQNVMGSSICQNDSVSIIQSSIKKKLCAFAPLRFKKTDAPGILAVRKSCFGGAR